MSTEKSVFDITEMSSQPETMRLCNTESYRLCSGIMGEPHPVFSDDHDHPTMTPDDPRWVFAMRVRLLLEKSTRDESEIDDLIESGAQVGLSPIASRGIFAIVQSALSRGAIDTLAIDQLNQIPEAIPGWSSGLSDRSRWLTFGALFVWALMIAGIMQVVV